MIDEITLAPGAFLGGGGKGKGGMIYVRSVRRYKQRKFMGRVIR